MNVLASQAHQHYQRAQVESANPIKLVLMLYDGAIRKITQAHSHLSEEKVVDFQEQVVKVQKILSELYMCLNTDTGGEVAENLGRLYDYMIRELGIAMIRRDKARLEGVRSILEMLREGWQGAMENTALEEMEAAAPAPAPVEAETFSVPIAPTGEEAAMVAPSLNIAG